MRLFTGIVIPFSVAGQLAALQPSPMPGMKLVKAGQMHLTLHFIGEGDVEAYRLKLEGLRVPGFSMMIESLGQFTNRHGTILWVGVRESAELMFLHRELEAALTSAGFQPEKRAYHPHLTLARCDGRVPKNVVENFLAQRLEPMEVKVEEVVLFSSVLSAAGPRYEREAVVRLM